MAPAAQIDAHSGAASALMARGLMGAAREELTRWLALVEPTGELGAIIPILSRLAYVAIVRGDSDTALGYLERGLSLAGDCGGNPEDRLKLYVNLMMLYNDRNRLDDATHFMRKAEALEAEKHPGFRLHYWLNRSALHWRRHEWKALLEASAQACEASLESADIPHRCKALTNRGIAYLELGNYDRAEQDLRETLVVGAELDPSELAYAYAELGRVHFLRGDYPGALEAGRKALGALFGDVAYLDKEEVARVSRLFGTIFATLGQRNLALKYLNRSAAYCSQLGMRAEWQRSTEIIGQVLAGPVRPARSQLHPEVHQLDFLTAVLDLTDDLESVDPYLRGHSERVASLARLLGETLDLHTDALTSLSYAARLHDVGMVAVDADLIRRDGPLSPAEKGRVALHTKIGEEMLRPFGLAPEGLAAVRYHHEHYDGSGYPEGLRGEAIPLFARIIAVVDIYDALTSDRAYRGAHSHSQAMDELQQMAGRELDPRLVERFVALHHIETHMEA
jgi:HD-GYP domain-containing protein (c-di-GMP phosphodiesterase class II)